MKRIEAWHTLHEMWGGATPEQKEALGIAMDDIEFVDLMRGHGVPLTNAQHIRSMTDEELAVMFAMIKADLTRLDRPVRPYQGRDVNDNYDWLKQPYEGENK